MSEAAEIDKELKEMKVIASLTLQYNQNSFQQIKSIKLARIQRQITYDNIFNLHYTTFKLLKIKRSKSLNQFHDSIQKLKTLDDNIARIGLNHCFKTIQLKIRYELEVYDLIETSEKEILGLIREEIRVKECLKEAKLMQRGNREVLRRIEEVEIMLRKKIDYDLVLVERIQRLEMLNGEILELEKKKEQLELKIELKKKEKLELELEVEELRRKVKMERVRNAADIVGSVLRFVIFILALIIWFRN